MRVRASGAGRGSSSAPLEQEVGAISTSGAITHQPFRVPLHTRQRSEDGVDPAVLRSASRPGSSSRCGAERELAPITPASPRYRRRPRPPHPDAPTAPPARPRTRPCLRGRRAAGTGPSTQPPTTAARRGAGRASTPPALARRGTTARDPPGAEAESATSAPVNSGRCSSPGTNGRRPATGTRSRAARCACTRGTRTPGGTSTERSGPRSSTTPSVGRVPANASRTLLPARSQPGQDARSRRWCRAVTVSRPVVSQPVRPGCDAHLPPVSGQSPRASATASRNRPGVVSPQPGAPS